MRSLATSDQNHHIGEFEGDFLKTVNRASQKHFVPWNTCSHAEDIGSYSQTDGRHAYPAIFKCLHCLDEAIANLAENSAFRHLAILKDQFGRGRAAEAHFIEGFAH